jgi:hypothetical protein
LLAITITGIRADNYGNDPTIIPHTIVISLVEIIDNNDGSYTVLVRGIRAGTYLVTVTLEDNQGNINSIQGVPDNLFVVPGSFHLGFCRRCSGLLCSPTRHSSTPLSHPRTLSTPAAHSQG